MRWKNVREAGACPLSRHHVNEINFGFKTDQSACLIRPRSLVSSALRSRRRQARAWADPGGGVGEVRHQIRRPFIFMRRSYSSDSSLNVGQRGLMIGPPGFFGVGFIQGREVQAYRQSSAA